MKPILFSTPMPELGAAGCGHPESRCEYLTSTLFGFSCKKYDADLKLWKGEPLRLRKCGDDAHKEWAKLREEQKRVLTTRQRAG